MIDWAHPLLLLLIVPAAAVVILSHRHSTHPMPRGRRRLLLALRLALIALVLIAWAGPAVEQRSHEEAVIFVIDHSASEGAKGVTTALTTADRLRKSVPSGTRTGAIAVAEDARVLQLPETGMEPFASLPEEARAATDLSAGLALARGLFPPGVTPRVVLLSDGFETRGDLETAAREAALSGLRLDAVPVAGELRPDVRAVALRPSRARLHEGASLELTAEIESSLAGEGRARLFENGIEVESRPVTVAVGETKTLVFQRTPEQRNLYSYRLRLEGFGNDALRGNNEALALVEVRGRPLLLYVEGEEGQEQYLADAMAREGLSLQVRPPEALPHSLPELNGFDGVILSDVAAHRLDDKVMTLLRDYVEKLGGGLVMIGGVDSFGVGGYYRTPIEEVLPVRIRAPDEEERQSVALAMVVDRSGSMSGPKIELCKSATSATVDLLGKQDHVMVVAFDSDAYVVVPMTRRGDNAGISSSIAAIDAGGGTNIYPGMIEAQRGLESVRTRIKHMIVLTDGQTSGSGYEALAAQLKAGGITVSTVGVGNDADIALLQRMAAAGGGQCYSNVDPAALTRVFTQDAMKHMGRLVREEEFTPRQVEQNVMLKDWDVARAPSLFGYVKTQRKATAQIPLVTDQNDPLLAQWRFGLGKVTAFTSDCKSRWASLWISGWPGYSQFWGQVLRETARNAQGDNMDLRLEPRGDNLRVITDVMEDAAHFRNDAIVEAELSYLPPGAAGSALKPLQNTRLEQVASGRYATDFPLTDPGLYLVQARTGAQTVSAGYVRNASGEASTGRVNTPLLERACTLTGGKVLTPDVEALPAAESVRTRVLNLAPPLLQLALLLFMADLALRRWEHLLGLRDFIREFSGRLRS